MLASSVPAEAADLYGQCLFCFVRPPATAFNVVRQYDYRGVPPATVKYIILATKHGFPACTECANFIRAKNQLGLAASHPVQDVTSRSYDIARAKKIAVSSSLMWQKIYWLGLATDLGKTIRLAQHMPAGFQSLWLLQEFALPHHDHPVFSNGVELWAYPIGEGDVLMLEELRSVNRGNGSARAVMRLIIDVADKTRATLVGHVEAHPFDNQSNHLSDEQLYAWYARLGFSREPADSDEIFREPSTRPATEIDASLRAALHEIKVGS